VQDLTAPITSIAVSRYGMAVRYGIAVSRYGIAVSRYSSYYTFALLRIFVRNFSLMCQAVGDLSRSRRVTTLLNFL
jgi:hypothetical protein